MPASGFVVPGSLADRICASLAEQPGQRTADLSRALVPDPAATPYGTRSAATLAIGAECSRLFRTGRIVRTQVSPPGRKVPITKYRLPDPAPATT